jgi:hypothetical protein
VGGLGLSVCQFPVVLRCCCCCCCCCKHAPVGCPPTCSCCREGLKPTT